MISEFLQSIEHDTYCRLKPSKVHGVGVFAIKDIGKGTDPFHDTPRFRYAILIKVGEVKKMSQEIQKIISDFYSSDGEYYHVGESPNNMGVYGYLNHSEDDPNVELSAKQLHFVTRRYIQKGEELLVNYKKYSKFVNNF